MATIPHCGHARNGGALAQWRIPFVLEADFLQGQEACLGDDFDVEAIVQKLIFRMVVENPTWGAPRIHGELLMLGFDVSELNGLSLDETSA